MSEATILQFPRRKVRAALRMAASAGDGRLLDLTCLSMSLMDDARHRPGDAGIGTAGDTRTTAFLCAGIILGAIDREEFSLD
jgi:hypothetical protein